MENRLYVENKDNFWRDLLVRIALILLFIFLLIWLFPMPKLETFYDRIFADNLKMMQDAAKDYFTVERLPIEIGDKKKLSLRDMIDKKMILPFLDRDGNTCDFDNSYVEVIKMETDYVFKVNLSCPTKTDYIIDYFGCYDVCEDDSCEKDEEDSLVLEYQFYRSGSKKVIDYYTCPSGYDIKGSSCVKESNILEKITAKLNCNTGFAYNSNTDSCEKSVTTSTDPDKTCPTGYVYNENSNTCLKYVVREEEPSKICSQGTYNPSTGKCVVGNTTTYNATLVCDSGTYNSSTGKCVITTPSSYDATPKCTTGTYDVSTKKCAITTPSSYTATPYCSVGTYNASTNRCDVVSPSNYPAVYACKTGTNNGTSCTITAATTVAALTKNVSSTYVDTKNGIETKKWSCQVYEYDYLRSNVSNSTFTRTYIGKESRYTCALPTCLTTFYKYDECTAVITGSCADRTYTYNRTTGKCTKTITTYSTEYYCANGATPTNGRCPVAAVTTPKVPTCPNGGNLLNDTCYTSNTTYLIPSYSCPNGGTISGTKCNVSTTTYVTPSYSCPNGGKISGTKCNVSTSTTINPRYTCPNGGDLANKTCYVSNSSTITPTLACNLGTLIGNVCKITTIDNKDYSYNCSVGSLNGNKCVTSLLLKEDVSYSCDYGYTRTGTECIKTISSSSIVKGTPVYKSISSQEYKWSRETSLIGWERTGKTREVKVAYNEK